MESPHIPALLTPKSNDIIGKEKNLIEFSLAFNEKAYNCSLKEINGNKVKLILVQSNLPFHIYEREFDLYDFQNLNKNFRIYDNFEELKIDLISYIKQKKVIISSIENNTINLVINIVAKKDNTVNITLKQKEKENVLSANKLDFFFEELENNKNEIAKLKNKLIEVEEKRKEEIMKKDKKINELEKRLERLENLFSQKINTENKNDLDKKNNIIKNHIIKLNLKGRKKENKIIKTNKPINEIIVFPKSGNFIESSGPKIFDKNFNLILSLDEIGFCEHICIITENLIILSQKDILILLIIINLKQGKYNFKTFNYIKRETIKKIIIGLNHDDIITSDTKSNICFWKMIFKDNDIELKVMNIIETNHNSIAYILLIKNMLIVGTDLLYLYDIGDNKNINKISSFNIQAKCWNSMIIINENKNLIGVGSRDRILILQINDFLQFKIIKEININYESS